MSRSGMAMKQRNTRFRTRDPSSPTVAFLQHTPFRAAVLDGHRDRTSWLKIAFYDEPEPLDFSCHLAMFLRQMAIWQEARNGAAYPD
jgi:hypothetical protein